MPTVNATSFLTLINKDTSEVEAKEVEALIDTAIDLLNLYGADISNMGGSSGSKSVSLDSNERGAVMAVCRVVYKTFFLDEEGATIGGVSIPTIADLMANQTIMNMIKDMGKLLTKPSGKVG